MKAFSRFHTPSLAAADRGKIAGALGLNRLPLRLEESCGGIVLRRWDCRRGVCWERSDFPAAEMDFAALGPQMPVETARPTEELWRELLPYPLSAVPSEDPAARFVTEAWKSAESEMADAELTLAWAGDSETGLPLLLHYVRRRCVRLGTSQNLREIARRALAEEGPESLGSFFGTRTHFLHWATPSDPKGHPLQVLADILRAAGFRPRPGKPVVTLPRSW